jgi:nucleoside phosphorylase
MGVDTLLFSADQMGRVPAAIATMRLLESFEPSCIIVAGIAGGFPASNANLGDVLTPQQIADLVTRKIRENEQGLVPEFRPRAFDIDDRMHRFHNSPQFSKTDWEYHVLQDAEWPAGKRPVIHSGVLASLDEVVSSAEWTKKLREAWPGLMGVEMESGGVCAAAREKGVKVVVVRGVSDLADPAKSDTEWRRRAIKTVAHLLECAFQQNVF